MHTVMNAELADMRAKLYYSILSKGIEHLWILLSVGVLKPIPLGYGGMTVLQFYIKKTMNTHTHIYIHTHTYICLTESLCYTPETNTTL